MSCDLPDFRLCNTEQTSVEAIHYLAFLIKEGAMSYRPICAICQEPVGLEESKTDEHGKEVHENCYVWTVELKKPSKGILQMDTRPTSPMF